MTDAVIALEGLGKRYGDFIAVDGLSLAVRRGELYALLGQNGAGKTTTIRMLMGVLKPSVGSAAIAGCDCFVQRVEVMRTVGYLPDEPVFHDYLRGRELIRFVADLHGIERATAEARAAALVERLDLGQALEEFAVNYSKGMKKKLALVLALLHQPTVLILDEPTNGLDPYATRTLHELMREQAAAGHTVFFSTHLLDQAERLCHRIGILARGRLVAEGTLEALRAACTHDASLEDIFFSVTGEDAPGAASGIR